MILPTPRLQRFFYSHHLLAGLRQSIGVLLPVIVLGGVFKLYHFGIITAMGALCVAIVDQAGGPRRYRTNEMLGAAVLGTVTVFITGLSSSSSVAIWLVVPTLGFCYSMLNVYGKRGGLIGFACLLLMVLTLRYPMSPDEVFVHTATSAAGAFFYFFFSLLFRRVFFYQDERSTLAVALFSTATYMQQRAKFYDTDTELDETYRHLIQIQAEMTESQQAARDMVLRELPKGGAGNAESTRLSMLAIYVNMESLRDSLVASHTDYINLRRSMGKCDFLLFTHDALYQMGLAVGHIALNISRRRTTPPLQSAKAEIRALEYELERYKKNQFNKEQPETYALLVQIVRRLRNIQKLINHMAAQTRSPSNDIPLDQYLEKSLSRFLSRDEIRFGMLTSNLRWNSATFRYAVRISCACILSLTVPTIVAYFSPQTEILNALTSYSYWIIMTCLVILKPGFSLTKQRNTYRLVGTALGCVVTFLLLQATSNSEVYLVVLLLAYILGNSLTLLNYMLSALFNTIFVLIAFQFLHSSSSFIIGERFVDTLIGCAIALICSYILPWWESNSMTSAAQNALQANKNYLRTGLYYAELNRQYTAATTSTYDEQALALSADTISKLAHDLTEAETQWQLARRQVHVSFSNFSAGFYRMMNEPSSHQHNVAILNNLLSQNHVLASQISASIPLLASLGEIPPEVNNAIVFIERELNNLDAPPVGTLETEGELAMLAYPLRQMMKASQLIRQDMQGLALSSGPPAPGQFRRLFNSVRGGGTPV
ncbi:putative membrane protein YccC [Paenalcaligenes hominis]|uniref:Membrane protein YccC n=1 Tax=Paenalcaligenes hominis TaxID=643674 RepID=A0ABX0WU93_9BURK|nr:FUSC family membrane protein [Paenalcaligenes hominis]NJB66334.1 putative membrane protein YccC [Paenalcaligenes hominis]GGE75090.1 membrane protein [Paenalcaligenes hominis]